MPSVYAANPERHFKLVNAMLGNHHLCRAGIADSGPRGLHWPVQRNVPINAQRWLTGLEVRSVLNKLKVLPL